MAVTIFHNPHCSTSRKTLALLQAHGHDPHVVEYLKTPPTVEELDHLLQLLQRTPRELMRTKESVYETSGASAATLSRRELLALMVEHPVLIERPIVVANGKAALGRPPEAVLAILE